MHSVTVSEPFILRLVRVPNDEVRMLHDYEYKKRQDLPARDYNQFQRLPPLN